MDTATSTTSQSEIQDLLKQSERRFLLRSHLRHLLSSRKPLRKNDLLILLPLAETDAPPEVAA